MQTEEPDGTAVLTCSEMAKKIQDESLQTLHGSRKLLSQIFGPLGLVNVKFKAEDPSEPKETSVMRKLQIQ